MPIIKSISGIRGTIGGDPGKNLTPIDIVECTYGFAQWIISREQNLKVVIGRDGRISGSMLSSLVSNTLIAMGIDVVDLGLSTTPTVEVAVPNENAGAGIVITASHNPKEWNALKFLNEKGEFISASDGEEILRLISENDIPFANINKLGQYSENNSYFSKHIEAILALDLIDAEKIRAMEFTVAVDAINSTGAMALPFLFEALNVKSVFINDKVNGEFAHNPEPLPAHLKGLSELVVSQGCDLGISVDPDVDRLALICEDGQVFGEEYTLVAVADYILKKTPGPTVSNLSSTRALRDITEDAGQSYFASSVGEVNVVDKMKAVRAVIGGEGNGGVIYPKLHYGRDAILGIAFILNLMAERNMSLSELKHSYPHYAMSKKKVSLTEGMNVVEILAQIASQYKGAEIDTQDGVKIYFTKPQKQWVHLRKSNTEPIIRVYTESGDLKKADALADKFVGIVNEIVKKDES